jgi:hypothetical protein
MISLFLLALSLQSEPAAAPRSKDFPRCVDASGRVSFHQSECPPGTRMDGSVKLQTSFEPPPPAPPSAPPQKKPPVRPPQPAQPIGLACAHTAWKCSAANGEVAYRHDACPQFVTALVRAPVMGSNAGFSGAMNDRATHGYALVQQTFPVVAEKVCRDTACKVLNERRLSGQQNQTLLDQQADTYTRNAGRDPCF